MAIVGTAVAVAILSLTAVLLHLSGGPETVDSTPAETRRSLANREDSAKESIADRTAEAEHRDTRVPPRGEPKSPPSDPAEFRMWMRSQDWEEFEAWATESLRTQFGQTIAETRNQVLLMELRQYLKENFPEDWDTKLHVLLHRAFPDHADRIFAAFSGMDGYNEWLEDSKFDLAGMQAEAIEEALWKKREEIFGEDAEEIWASDRESEHIRDLMGIVEEAYDLPLEDRLELFRDAVAESDRDGADPLMQDKAHVMALAFLNMESVQDELRRMSPDERAQGLRRIRRSIGIDEEGIEGLEKLDAERERRWQNGLRYMEEREDLARSYEGVALEEELRFLREGYFGDEARTIEAEESSGFFRFRRRRVYGRN